MPNDKNFDYPTNLVLFFSLDPQFLDILREPEASLVVALAKIGCLFALLRVSIILNIWHQLLFESSMKSKSTHN